VPKNFVTKKEYRGVNCLLLHLNDFIEPYYLTFLQIKKLGGSVKPGSKAQIIIYWNWVESKTKLDSKGDPAAYPFLEYYQVFNIEQAMGIEYESTIEQLDKFEKDDTCESIITGYKNRPQIVHQKQQACYSPITDTVNMPVKKSFNSCEEYYATLFHELIHSTGHKDRLKREGIKDLNVFGSEVYSKEELIAEIGASFLCAKASIDTRTFTNSVSYIKGWLSVLKKDSKFLVHSANQAQKATDYILNKKFSKVSDEND